MPLILLKFTDVELFESRLAKNNGGIGIDDSNSFLLHDGETTQI